MLTFFKALCTLCPKELRISKKISLKGNSQIKTHLKKSGFYYSNLEWPEKKVQVVESFPLLV